MAAGAASVSGAVAGGGSAAAGGTAALGTATLASGVSAAATAGGATAVAGTTGASVGLGTGCFAFATGPVGLTIIGVVVVAYEISDITLVDNHQLVSNDYVGGNYEDYLI